MQFAIILLWGVEVSTLEKNNGDLPARRTFYEPVLE